MINELIALLVGFILASAVLLLIWWKRRNKKQPKSRIYVSIEDIRSVGELIVFKILTKEIVTTAEHWFGEWGKKYLNWLASSKKMAMIFEFEINFRYNLRSPDFIIEQRQEKHYRLIMPKCFYDIYIRDINFYDEQSAKLLPWLLPELLTRAFGPKFDETDKNRLKEEARQQAARIAGTYAEKMRSEVQSSAAQTLEMLARRFGAEEVTVDFEKSELVATSIESQNNIDQ